MLSVRAAPYRDFAMRLLLAAMVAVFPLVALAQIPDQISIEGNDGTAGAATGTIALPPPDGSIVDICTNVTSCASSVGTAPASGAQVSTTVATPTGDIESTCINSTSCSTILGQ